MSEVLTPSEAARVLRISQRKLALMREDIPPIRVGKRSVRYVRSTIEEYLQRQLAAAAANELPEPQTAEATASA